jgi:hypothetical protein
MLNCRAPCTIASDPFSAHGLVRQVHGPIEAPPQYFGGCTHIKATIRQTYCAMMQALDQGIANVTGAYRNLQIFDDTVWLLLADNGGMPSEGGFNVPLRGHKATVCAPRPLPFRVFSATAPSTGAGGDNGIKRIYNIYIIETYY